MRSNSEKATGHDVAKKYLTELLLGELIKTRVTQVQTPESEKASWGANDICPCKGLGQDIHVLDEKKPGSSGTGFASSSWRW